ncbi:predicted protein [Uncinocarpus reesii 1704]|uniref:Uncharacterized protein n=1 Tax=Uncinocarpus reesii (strain UAMH 1704) TaxID=336963 RepID=C4JMR4_UNCRE|nr:uncharacterized protein UREG_04122 [Uncinocarpus reesii 1704]EEP79276.1 predicted protein [Uncinocarpus reesii 1704]
MLMILSALKAMGPGHAISVIDWDGSVSTDNHDPLAIAVEGPRQHHDLTIDGFWGLSHSYDPAIEEQDMQLLPIGTADSNPLAMDQAAHTSAGPAFSILNGDFCSWDGSSSPSLFFGENSIESAFALPLNDGGNVLELDCMLEASNSSEKTRSRQHELGQKVGGFPGALDGIFENRPNTPFRPFQC